MRRDSGRNFLGVDAPSVFYLTAQQMHDEDKRLLVPLMEQLRATYIYLKNKNDLAVQKFLSEGGEISRSGDGDVYTLKDSSLQCFKDGSGMIFRKTLNHPASQAGEAKRLIDVSNAVQSALFYEREKEALDSLIGRFSSFSPERGVADE